MTDLYPPSENTLKNAIISQDEYERLYKRSIENPDAFWRDMAKRLDWSKSPSIIKSGDFNDGVAIRWYEDGRLNACYNCVDRHLPTKANDVALIWEGDERGVDKKITYQELKNEICRLANALKSLGVKRGDRVIIYLPTIPEAAYAMLACARIGAVHSVVFAGFSPESIRSRIEDCGAKIIITADQGKRGGKTVPLKNNVDEAIKTLDVEKVIVLEHTGGDVIWDNARDIWWHELVDDQSNECPCEDMNAEDALFILYTSGSTGKPKGVLHTTGGYLVFAALTHEWVFDYKPGDIYWCTADVGWVTGHSYIVYGPLANGVRRRSKLSGLVAFLANRR